MNGERRRRFARGVVMSTVIIVCVLATAGVASADPIEASVVNEDDIKDGEPYDIHVEGSGPALEEWYEVGCNGGIDVIERDGFPNGNDLLIESYPIVVDPENGEFSTTITLDSSTENPEEVWDEDGNPAAELRVKLTASNLLCNTEPLQNYPFTYDFSTQEFSEPDPEDPDPSDKEVTLPDSVRSGESFTVDVIGSNFGGHIGENGAIQVEFPQLDQDSDSEYIGSINDGGTGTMTKISPGDTIYNKDGFTQTADYWQAENYFGPDDMYMVGANTETFLIDVTAPPRDSDNDGLNENYEFEINTRMTVTDDVNPSEYFSAPSDNDGTDDQGFDVERHVVEIEGSDQCPNEPEDDDEYEDNDGCPENPAPSVSLSGASVSEGGSTTLTANANDPEGESLSYDWSLSGSGRISGNGASATYNAPSDISSDTSATVTVTVEEPDNIEGGPKTDQDSATVTVNNDAGDDDDDGDGISNSDDSCPNDAEDFDGYEDSDGCPENPAPSVSLSGASVQEGGSTTLTASANDPEGDSLSYDWSATDGSISGRGSSVTYNAPSGISSNIDDTVTVTVTEPDERKSDQDSATVSVTKDTPPANFDVSIDSTNSPVQESNTLTVDATVTNTGGESDSQTIQLDAGSLGSDSQSVSLGGSESSSVTLSVSTSSGDAGSYTATVSSDDDTDTESVTVEEGATGDTDFSVEVNHNPSVIELGETGELSATIENVGDSSGTQTIEITLYKDGNQIESSEETFTLDPGESEVDTGSVEYTEEDIGDWEAQICSENECDSTSWTVVDGDTGGNEFQISDRKICTDIQDAECPPEDVTDNIQPTDERVISWVKFSDIDSSYEITWEFYDPSGNLYTTVEATGNEDGSYEGTYRHWAWTDVDGQEAADMPGEWSVDVSVEGTHRFTDTFTIDGESGNGENDKFEPNDDFSSAASVSPGDYTDLQIVDGESDFFAVNLDRGDRVTSSIQFSHSNGDLDLAIYGPDRNEVTDSTSTSDDEQVSTTAQQSGAYYIEAYGFSGASAPYSLDISVDGGDPSPTADFTYSPSSPSVGERVTFEIIGFNSAQYSDDTVIDYELEYGDGSLTRSVFTPSDGGSLDLASHAFDSPGDYTVTLTLTDDDGDTGTVTKTVTVEQDGGSSSGNPFLDGNGDPVPRGDVISGIIEWTTSDDGSISGTSFTRSEVIGFIVEWTNA